MTRIVPKINGDRATLKPKNLARTLSVPKESDKAQGNSPGRKDAEEKKDKATGRVTREKNLSPHGCVPCFRKYRKAGIIRLPYQEKYSPLTTRMSALSAYSGSR